MTTSRMFESGEVQVGALHPYWYVPPDEFSSNVSNTYTVREVGPRCAWSGASGLRHL
ncbi:MAG: hypothetical protein U0075_05955 [Thermomicrobiales bacterium]